MGQTPLWAAMPLPWSVQSRAAEDRPPHGFLICLVYHCIRGPQGLDLWPHPTTVLAKPYQCILVHISPLLLLGLLAPPAPMGLPATSRYFREGAGRGWSHGLPPPTGSSRFLAPRCVNRQPAPGGARITQQPILASPTKQRGCEEGWPTPVLPAC